MLNTHKEPTKILKNEICYLIYLESAALKLGNVISIGSQSTENQMLILHQHTSALL